MVPKDPSGRFHRGGDPCGTPSGTQRLPSPLLAAAARLRRELAGELGKKKRLQQKMEQTEFFFASRGGSTELKIKREDQYLSG